MNILNPQPARADVTDRNPVQRALTFVSLALAPHVSTQRATYTVPAGKKARITTARLSTLRTTVATTAAKVQANALYTPSGGTAGSLYMVWTISNTLGSSDELNHAAQHTMTAGDSLALFTLDQSTGGAIDYDLYVAILEYDA